MTWWSEELAVFAVAAQEPGESQAPEALLILCGELQTPLTSLANDETSRPIFEALHGDLGFVWPIRHAKKALSADHRGKLEATMRWLIAEMVMWRGRDDANGAKLAAVLATAARLDEDGALWRVLPDSIAANPDLGGGLIHVLENMRINLAMGFSRAPISEGEQLDAILEAETQKDWPALRTVAEGVAYGHLTSVLVSQSIRLLHRFFPAALVQYGRGVGQIGMAMQIVTQLSVTDGFDLGRESGNDFLQFASACRLFNQYSRVPALAPAEEDALVGLLRSVADEPPRWAAWMKAFVAHPYRASQMQPALGRCLASSAEDAAVAYLEALVLQVSFLGREEVKACLLAFANNAPLERRQQIWRAAFARWSAWNYGEAEGERGGSEVSLCNLDFAIMCYAVECQTEDERNAFIAGCIDMVGRAEHRWQRSQNGFIGYVYRALSRIQPFAHAQTATADPATWLWSPNGGHLLHLLNDPYWRIRYQLHKYDEVAAKAQAALASDGPQAG